MRRLRFWTLASGAGLLLGCAGLDRGRFGATESGLQLSRVVLYRNGVGYFERAGEHSGQQLTLRCRKDQINDVLKSLTVVDRRSGQAVSVSMPLDPQRWASAAAELLTPGQGNLARVLDALRGTRVELDTTQGVIRGRVLMVETLPGEGGDKGRPPQQRISLLDGSKVNVTLLAQVLGVTFRDGDVAMQLHRSLDASAGEGMFKQVTVSVRLAGPSSHDLALSYVVSAPLWQPTYRIVLPEEGRGEALLQGWAVVANSSGEDWRDVQMSLTSGAPLAFRYDLHTPREVAREDMTARAVARQGAVAMGETSFEEERAEVPPPPGAPSPSPMAAPAGIASRGPGGGGRKRAVARAETAADELGGLAAPAAPPPPPAMTMEHLARSTKAAVQARQVSGMTQFELQERVTVPDGTATMVALLNRKVKAEQAFLYRPGGSGAGYEANPYRVVRFRNSTPFVLEPGPISIYAGGSFVGEGMSAVIGADSAVTIPFSVEPSLLVSQSQSSNSGEVRLVRISGGTLLVESAQRLVTRWVVRGPKQDREVRVLVRQPRRGSEYVLKGRPTDTEDLPDGYLIPVVVAAGKTEGALDVVEETPVRRNITIWDGQAETALQTVLATSNLSTEARSRLQPLLALRGDIAKIETELEALRRQQQALDQRAAEVRSSLDAIKKDPQATELRGRLSQRLEGFLREADALARRTVELNSRRLERRLSLEERLQNLDLEVLDNK